MPFYDFHIHTRYSGCCKQDYMYPEVAQQTKLQGLDGFGVSDHCNYRSYHPKSVAHYRQLQHEMGLEDKGLVGLEITILNRKGNLGIHPKYLAQLDYYIISEHLHIAKLFSDFYNVKKKMAKWIEDPEKNAGKIKHHLDRMMEMELNGIKNNPHSIFAHIFRFPLNIRYIPNVMLDYAEEILHSLADNDVALEMHSSHLRGFNMDDDAANQWKKAGDLNVKEFYHELYALSRKIGVKYALGSDAHRIEDIFSRTQWESFLQQTGVAESDLITPEFFHA